VLKQLLVSLVVVVVAVAGYVFLVPDAPQLLARVGINLPIDAAPSATPGSAGGPGAGRPGGGGRGGFGGRSMVVVTAPVGTGAINDTLGAIGEGSAAQSVTVMAPSSGMLDEVLVRPGQVVESGAVIARLDADAEEIAFERASIAQQDAEAALARTQELASANSATTVQLNAAQLAASNAALATRSARLELDRRTITAPIAGTVGLFQVSRGNQVTAQSVVTTIEDTSEIIVTFWVPERYAPMLATDLPVTASAVALPGVAISGEVSALDNRIDPTSRTLKVEARIDNTGARLRPGMSFAVDMRFPGESFPTVDPLAIQWSSTGAYVWRYAEGKVARVDVEVIQRNSDGVLVKGELAQGDEVVTQGVQQLSDGAEVRLLDEAIAAAAGGGGEGGQGRRPAQQGNGS
jgi:RND family efflux transporter MFP subunit